MKGSNILPLNLIPLWLVSFAATAAMLLNGCSSLDPCENTFIRQVTSPNGKLKAVVFSRGCGATTSESVQISILEVNAPLPEEAGNVSVVEESNVYVNWLSSSQRQVIIPAASKIYTQEQKYGSITIIYKQS